jgi:hypothetical protein
MPPHAPHMPVGHLLPRGGRGVPDTWGVCVLAKRVVVVAVCSEGSWEQSDTRKWRAQPPRQPASRLAVASGGVRRRWRPLSPCPFPSLSLAIPPAPCALALYSFCEKKHKQSAQQTTSPVGATDIPWTKPRTAYAWTQAHTHTHTRLPLVRPACSVPCPRHFPTTTTPPPTPPRATCLRRGRRGNTKPRMCHVHLPPPPFPGRPK